MTETFNQQDEIPEIEEYRDLRKACGLSPKTPEAAKIGLPNSLYSTTIRKHERIVAMGRVVGDGGCNLEIVDIAVHPDFQRMGLGQMIMTRIMLFVEQNAPDSAYVSLIADHHSPALYSKFGFRFTAPKSVGMALKVGALET
jgi:ribosomal protein S18 acetylase RimI-like enzyme